MLRRVSNFKFEHLSLRNVLGVIDEPVHELPVPRWLGPETRLLLLLLLAELLELKALKVDFFEALHLRVVLSCVIEGAL